MFPTTWIFIKMYDKNSKNYPTVWRIKLYVSIFLFCIKIVSLHQFRHSSVHVLANRHPFDKHQRTKNNLQIALRQQTELPHPLLTSSSSKTTNIVRKQRYTRTKYKYMAVHLQKIKSFGRGPEYPLVETPRPPFRVSFAVEYFLFLCLRF